MCVRGYDQQTGGESPILEPLMEGIQHRGGKGRRKTEGPKEAVGVHLSRTQVKHRKAVPLGESVHGDEARYPSARNGSGDGMGGMSVGLTHGDLPGSGRTRIGGANHR